MAGGMTTLTTERLTLTPTQASDYETLRALWADPVFTHHISGGKGFSPEEVWLRLLRDIGHWSVLGYGNWQMRQTVTGDYVGSVGILDYRRDLDPPFDAPELGWGVAPAFQGQGYAQEGVNAALSWADTVLKAPRTVCMIDPANTPSLKLAERVGYRPYADATFKGVPIVLLERFTG